VGGEPDGQRRCGDADGEHATAEQREAVDR
jgi:hypothetical protein